ncbi:MAG: ATP phosphoribosyltransferase [Methylobacteriaceae bacterium]|nr:ATP phosphoribosyltransferase [Methylobacteriaceae bacterium]
MSGSSSRLVLAVPSKGRLQENAAAFFARAGLELTQGRGARDYRGALIGAPGVEVAFLSASEIAAQLASGAAHLGVTGEDLIRESLPDADARLELLTPLGFGHANVVVAVPEAWIDVRGMADLEDVAAAYRARRGARMRVATKYVNLTRAFFARAGVADYRIVESLGATEGAPAAGGAELIVDITTTGATLKANALKVLEDGVILRSEANLVASLTAEWGPAQREAARAVLARIAAEEEARKSRELRAFLPRPPADLAAEAEARFGARAPFGPPADGRVALVCPAGQAAALADWLIGLGAADVAVSALAYLFRAESGLYARLAARLPQE